MKEPLNNRYCDEAGKLLPDFEAGFDTLVDSSVSFAPNGDSQQDIANMIKAEAVLRRSEEKCRILEERLLLAQKQEEINGLASGVAHDINNILTIISGCSTLIKDGLDDSSELHTFAMRISTASEMIAALTSQLLGDCNQLIQPSSNNPNRVLLGMKHILEHILGKDIELSFNLAVEPVQTLADQVHLGQIIMNLVINARDAMPNGGTIVIETSTVEPDEADLRQHGGSRPGRYVLLSVRDNGCGMHQETISRIFDPYFTTKAKDKGAGLGLATVYEIVNKCGGHICVISEPGLGTTFNVYLPFQVDK